MTPLPNLVFSIILILVLSQPGHAKTSTENLIIEKSDIFKRKKSVEIEEGDFVEDVPVIADNFAWIVNLKNGPFHTKEKAKQVALDLKKSLDLTLTGLLKEISIIQELKTPKNKNFDETGLSWTVNFRLGSYDSKVKAMQIIQKLKITQKLPENVFLTRESSDVKTSKLAKNIATEVSGKIFLTHEVNPTKDKTENFILITTKSNSLNVRKNPSPSSPVIAGLLRGSKVPHIKDDAPGNSSGDWFYVEYSKGKFGWISSLYSRKIIDSDSRVSQQANLKTIKPKKVQIRESPKTGELRKLKSIIDLLRIELEKIKSDKIETIEQRNYAREKLEGSITTSNKTIKDLQATTASLRSELDKIKSDKARAIKASAQASAKLQDEKIENAKLIASIKSENKKEIDNLKLVTASLDKELQKTKIDQAKLIKSSNQANAKAKDEKLASLKEFKNLKEKSSVKIKDLQSTTASLRSELDKIKSDKARAIKASAQASAKLQDEKIENAKLIASIKAENKKEIDNLKLITASLQKEFQKTRIDQAKLIESSNQANAEAKEEKLASIKEFKSLKEKSSVKIKDLQSTTASLRSELDKIKSDKVVAIEAARQANDKAEEEKIANNKKLNNLKATSSAEIKGLQRTTALLQSKLDKIKSSQSAETIKDLQAATSSLRSKLEKMRSEKIVAVETTRKANTKAKEEKLASIKEFETLKEKSAAEIKFLQATTASLHSELDKIKTDNAVAIEAARQANAKAKEEKLASINELESLKEKSATEIKDLQATTAALRSDLDQIKSNSARMIKANAKAKEEKLASIKELETLKEKSAIEIKDLQETTSSLRSDLDQMKSDKARAIEVNARMKKEQLANINEKNALKEKINALRIVLDKFKIDKDKTIQANAKAKGEQLVLIKKFDNLKEKSSAEIKDLQSTTASLRSELNKIKSEKTKAVNEAAKQANAKSKEEQLAGIKEFKLLKEKSTTEIKFLKAATASLRSELGKIKSDKAKAIKASDQASAKLQDEQIASAKLIESIKDKNKKEIDNLKLVTASLHKELQKTKIDQAKLIKSSKQASAKIRAENLRNIEFQNKLKDTVIFLRKELDQTKSDKNKSNQTHEKLNAGKLANSDEINRLKKSSDREIKNLNTTIKNLRTVLEKFKTEKRKTAENRKSLERKIETERILSAKEINAFKNESTALKLKLDKANLDRIKAIETINRKDRKTQTSQLTLENEFKRFKQESEKEIANLKGVAESLRGRLTLLKAEKTRSTQQKKLLSSIKNPQRPTDSKRTKRKNKPRTTSDRIPKNGSDNRDGSALTSTDIVTSNLFNWANAWENQNVPLYLSFYSKSFKDPKRSRSKWETYRRRSLKNALNISIQLSNIKAFIYRKNSIKVTFIQRFKSNKFSDIGRKELIWKKDADGWKIIKETWRPR